MFPSATKSPSWSVSLLLGSYTSVPIRSRNRIAILVVKEDFIEILSPKESKTRPQCHQTRHTDRMPRVTVTPDHEYVGGLHGWWCLQKFYGKKAEKGSVAIGMPVSPTKAKLEEAAVLKGVPIWIYCRECRLSTHLGAQRGVKLWSSSSSSSKKLPYSNFDGRLLHSDGLQPRSLLRKQKQGAF